MKNKRNIIVVVDDSKSSREILKKNFRDKYEIMEAENGQEALDLLKSHNRRVAAVLLDIVMPVMNGLDALERMKKREYPKRFPIFVITVENSAETLKEAYRLGAVDIIHKPFVPVFLKKRVDNLIELYAARAELAETVDIQKQKIIDMRRNMFEGLVSVVDFRDKDVSIHGHRVYNMTKELLSVYHKYEKSFSADEDEINCIAEAAILHDIGKISIPDTILTKSGNLNDEEFEVMKQHTVNGSKMLHKLLDKDDPIYAYAYDICRHHHERWDGKGYPDRLVRGEISIPAQVVGLVDAYDALRNERYYGRKATHEEAVDMILNGECGLFGKHLLKCFKEHADKMLKYK